MIWPFSLFFKGSKKQVGDKAVLVGINRYTSAPLSGCVNDIDAMADYLVKEQGFPIEGIRKLADERATTKAILERLEWMVSNAKPGERCFFHFSGHGTQTASRNGAGEVDGLDEVICPVDFNWSDEKMIRDDKLIEIFSRLPVGVKFYWVSDSCHSGDLTRGIGPEKAQFNSMETARRDNEKRMVPPSDLAWRIKTAQYKSLQSKRAMIGKILDVGFVSGCRSDQTSADTWMEGKPCGALTYFFLRNLRGNKDTPLNKVVEATREELAKFGYSQQPQCEGARADKPFLS
jgi:metacaspase-1